MSGRAGATPGTVRLLVGLGAVAGSGYAFLGLASHVFGPAGSAPLSVLWTVSNAVGAGLFVPVEQELARRVAARLALGRPTTPVVRPLAGLTVLLFGLLLVAAAAFGGEVADALFAGHAGLVGCLLATCGGFAAQHLSRGVLAGHGRFGSYGSQLCLDAVLRAGGAAALAAAGVHSLLGYGLVLAVSPAVSVLPMLRAGPAARPAAAAPRPVEPAVPRPDRDDAVLRTLGLVVVGQLLSTAIVGAGPVAATLLAGPGEAAAAGVVIGVMLVTRVPLLGFYAVQATMLPALARLVAVADWPGVRRRLAGSGAAVAVAAAVCTLAAWPLGPPAIRLVLGPGFRVGGALVAVLVAAMFVYIAAAITAQALLAVHGHAWSALAWAGGAAVYVLLLSQAGELAWRVSLAFLGSGLAALALAAVPLVLAVLPVPAPSLPVRIGPSPGR